MEQSGKPLKILMVSSEAVPFAKTGGLSDVVASLSVALTRLGLDVRIVLPLYGFINREQLEKSEITIKVPLGVGEERASIRVGHLGEVPVYFIENDALYGRGGIYGDRSNVPFADNVKRFAMLSRGALALCRATGWIPDVVHVHDWPSGLAPCYVRHADRTFAGTASVLTIHNIGYQGIFPKQDLYAAGLPWEELRDGPSTISFLRAAARAADVLTTVSPTYAREIQSPEYGAGMDELLRERRRDLVGILNGMDYGEWNPEQDPLLAHHFSHVELAGKALLKRELQRRCGLPDEPEVPVVGMVSRLVEQKGFVELCGPEGGSLEQICSEMTLQVVVLGTGEPWCERRLTELAARLPNLRVFLEFNNGMAHLIEAGSDFFLMPSRYEPCGLNQMYSLRYGTLPIVRRTGGLADTVEQYDQDSGEGTGFLFDDLTPRSIYDVTGWAVWAWYNHPEHIDAMRRRAMQKRFSWELSAQEYVSAYLRAIDRRRSSGTTA